MIRISPRPFERRPRAISLHQSGRAMMMVLLAVLAVSGCARRMALTPDELERVRSEATVSTLRVYPERRLIVVYESVKKDADYRVQKTIVESSARDRIKSLVTRGTAGLILRVDEQHGMPLLWVTFDPSCVEISCAYGFVETESDRYRLASVPKVEGYAAPEVYRSNTTPRRRLRTGKVSSLAEANAVYVARTPRGKILTLDLEVKKIDDAKTRTQTRRSRGIE